MPLTGVALQGLVLRGVPTLAVDVLKLPAVHTGPVDAVQNAPLTATLESRVAVLCSVRGTSETEQR